MKRATTNRRRRVMAASFCAVLGATALVGCGDDDSAQDRYCEAGRSLETSLSALFDLDVIAEGTNGLRTALEAVGDDIQELRDSASDAVADDVEALNDSIDGLGDSLEAAGDSLGEEGGSGVVDAIDDVRSAFGAIGTTLADC